MSSRPLVTVYGSDSSDAVSQINLPAVLTAPIRSDVVQFTHQLMAKNKRQPYAVKESAGHEVCSYTYL